jgi:hypothetical protein
LLPETTVTTRSSSFQPMPGTLTRTTCWPIETLALIGVVLPVSTPSIHTPAPDGYDVTFREPLPDWPESETPANATTRTQSLSTFIGEPLRPMRRTRDAISALA